LTATADSRPNADLVYINMVKVTLYSGNKCPHCKNAKAYLQQQQIPFVEMNVDSNRRAAKTLQSLGARGVPFLVIGKQTVAGFNPKQIRSAYEQQR
jgi:glutaredoxin